LVTALLDAAADPNIKVMGRPISEWAEKRGLGELFHQTISSIDADDDVPRERKDTDDEHA